MQSRSAASTAEVSSVLLSPLAFHGGNITLQILGEAAAGGESSSSSKKVIFVNRGGVVVVVGYMKVGARARHGDVSAACTLQGGQGVDGTQGTASPALRGCVVLYSKGARL